VLGVGDVGGSAHQHPNLPVLVAFVGNGVGPDALPEDVHLDTERFAGLLHGEPAERGLAGSPCPLAHRPTPSPSKPEERALLPRYPPCSLFNPTFVYTSAPTRTSTMPLVMRFPVASPIVKRVSPRYGPLSLTS
jgi:hypothetical protein